MNYANMIEEKNLKKTFIIATLCSTLIGTFTSSMGLWDRVNEKRKQRKTDNRQDNEMRLLREQVEKNTKAHEEQSKKRDDLGSNFQMSGAMIQRQYDEGFGKLGQRFAIGDTLTENQLQAQIITLQQTVISVLQDALYHNRPLTRADHARITAASDAARENSVDALRKQQQRLALEAAPPPLPPPIQPSSLSLAPGPPPRRDSPPSVIDGVLFCPYATDLQYIPDRPLAADFAPGGKCRCPDCGVRIPVTSEDFWKIGKTSPLLITEKGGYEKTVVETREFVLRQRFVIKCHMPDGQYACVLCNKHRHLDAICRSVESLVNHVGKFHDIRELEKDLDLKETRPAGKRLALPPPPPKAPSPPGTVREREVKEVFIL